MTDLDERETDSGYPRLEQQIRWYDSKSKTAQRLYRRAKVAEITCAAAIPFMAKTETTVAAVLGIIIVILEGLQQVYQWHQNWITYRSTCEALRHEKYSYLGKSDVYATKDDEEAKRILVQRVEMLVSTEHSKWISRQEHEARKSR